MNVMMEAILTLPDQFRWGIDLDPVPIDADRPIVLLGMGGSAMAASVASLSTSSAHPVAVHRSYGLPEWAVQSEAAVIAISYSGNTEEVLSGVDAALTAGLEVAAIASGGRLAELAEEHDLPIVRVPAGMQPRAGIGYQTAATMRVLGASGVVADASGELAEAAALVEELLAGGSGPAVEQGSRIAAKLNGKTTIIYGGFGVGAAAAYRWKTQLNENGKVPAYASVVPEMNHNELEGWHPGTGDHFALVWLHDSQDHPRIKQRLDLSSSAIGDTAVHAATVDSSGVGTLARLSSLAIVGDVASVAVADLAGTDPVPVEAIERFKVQLGKEDQ